MADIQQGTGGHGLRGDAARPTGLETVFTCPVHGRIDAGLVERAQDARGDWLLWAHCYPCHELVERRTVRNGSEC